MDTIVRIDMGAPGRPRARLEAVGGYAGLGGRSMVSTVLWREMAPDCHPMGPANKLVIAPGLLAGSKAALAARLALGCKSPVSARLAVADLGGGAACALGRLGLAAVIIEGRRVCADLWTVRIGPSGVTVERTAPSFIRKERHRKPAGDGDPVAVIRPGAPANPGTAPGRGGLGEVWAVMALKGVARLVIDAGGASPARPCQAKGFASANRRFVRGLARRYGGPATEICPRDGRTGCGLRCPDLPIEVAGVFRAGLPGNGCGPEDTVAAAALADEAGGETPPLGCAGPDAASAILACGGIDRQAPEGKAEIARTLRLARAALESTGYCSRLGIALLETPKTFQALLDTVNAFAGLTLGGEDLLALGRDILRKEQAFNRRAGFGPVHDRLPWFFRGEAIAPRLPRPRPSDAAASQVSIL